MVTKSWVGEAVPKELKTYRTSIKSCKLNLEDWLKYEILTNYKMSWATWFHRLPEILFEFFAANYFILWIIIPWAPLNNLPIVWAKPTHEISIQANGTLSNSFGQFIEKRTWLRTLEIFFSSEWTNVSKHSYAFYALAPAYPYEKKKIPILQIIEIYIQHRTKYISTGHLVPNTDHMYCHYGAPRFRMPSISVNCQCSFNLGEVQGALRQGLQEKPDCLWLRTADSLSSSSFRDKIPFFAFFLLWSCWLFVFFFF